VSAYSEAVLADSPSFYARLGETSGTAAADAVGGAAGTYTGGFTLGQPGLLPADDDEAVALNGSSGYVTVADRAALDLADTFTLECWVSLTQYQDGSPNPVAFIDKGANAYILRISNAVDGTFILRRNGVATLVTSTARIPLRTACHVVATKSGSTVKLYLNGADVTGTVTNATMTDNALPLGIGAADIASAANGFLGGTIDEVALYPSALSTARVQAHYLIGVRARTLATAGAGG
jgi:hypothetical protein